MVFEAEPLNVKAYGIELSEVYSLVTKLGYRIATEQGENVPELASFILAGKRGNLIAYPD